jgi:hypothetical protein
MKIGIMTFWWSDDNYGQILQCYALQKYLCDAGHDTYLIRYDPRNDYVKTSVLKKALKVFNPVKLINHLSYKKRLINNRREEKDNPRRFNNFREKYIKQSEKIYYSYDELVSNPPEADVYITGSDQVWNTFSLSFERARKKLQAYFLDFGDSETKRIAYAASFGKETIADDFIRAISPLLKRFDYISVREKSGLTICRQCGIENADWVLDPTLLLTADNYRSLYKNEQPVSPGKPYLFLYLLGNKTRFSVETVYQQAKEKNLEVVYVSGNVQMDKHKKVYATIPQWISLIDNAEYIITNSFHGCVFSLIFHKPFIPIMLTGKYVSGMNTRLKSLFELLELKFTNDNQNLLKNIYDFDKNRIDKKLSDLKDICKLLEKIHIPV